MFDEKMSIGHRIEPSKHSPAYNLWDPQIIQKHSSINQFGAISDTTSTYAHLHFGQLCKFPLSIIKQIQFKRFFELPCEIFHAPPTDEGTGKRYLK